MKQISSIATLLIVSIGVASLLAIPSPSIAAYLVQESPANTDTIVTRTIHLNYMLPSQAVQLLTTLPESGTQILRETVPPVRKLPEGVADLTAKDDDLTLTIRGTRKSIKEITEALRFLDVKPRQIQIKMRLVEIQQSADGTKQEKLLQSPILTTTNNSRAAIGVNFTGSASTSLTTGNEQNASHSPDTSISVMPHINGDDSIFLQVSMKLSLPTENAINPLVTTVTKRMTKQGEWLAFRPVSLSTDKKIKNDLIAGVEPIPAAAYPLYRLEVSATELIAPQK